MNLNFHYKPDYHLNTMLIDEMINLYGTPVRFLVMDKIQDKSISGIEKIFGDFKTLKTDIYRDALEFFVLISDSEEYPNGLAFAFNQFGVINDDTLTAYVSLESFKSLEVNGQIHPKEIISNVLVFPNGKIMEITDCQLHVPGVNNKFVYSNTPSCYQLSLKSYSFDRSAVDLIQRNDDRIELAKNDKLSKNTVKNIDEFFTRKDKKSQEIMDAATAEQIIDSECLTDKVGSTKIDDVFGSYA